MAIHTSTTQEKILQSKVQKCSHHRASSPLEAYARQKRVVSCRFSFTHMSTYNTLHFLCFQSCFCHEEMLLCRIISSWKKSAQITSFLLFKEKKRGYDKKFRLVCVWQSRSFGRAFFAGQRAKTASHSSLFVDIKRGLMKARKASLTGTAEMTLFCLGKSRQYYYTTKPVDRKQ